MKIGPTKLCDFKREIWQPLSRRSWHLDTRKPRTPDRSRLYIMSNLSQFIINLYHWYLIVYVILVSDLYQTILYNLYQWSTLSSSFSRPILLLWRKIGDQKFLQLFILFFWKCLVLVFLILSNLQLFLFMQTGWAHGKILQ